MSHHKSSHLTSRENFSQIFRPKKLQYFKCFPSFFMRHRKKQTLTPIIYYFIPIYAEIVVVSYFHYLISL